MKKNYVARIILNLTKDVCAYPADILVYESSTSLLTVYRGGTLIATTDEVTPDSLKSMIALDWLRDAKASNKAAEMAGVGEEEIIPLDMTNKKLESIPEGTELLDIEIAPTVEVVDWEEDEVIPMEAPAPNVDNEIENLPLNIEVGPTVETTEILPTAEVDGDEDIEVIGIDKEEGVGAAKDSIDGEGEVVSIKSEPEVVKTKKSTKKK